MRDSEFEWDDAKAARSLARHRVAFDAVREFDWDRCMTREDARGDYGERRFVSIGRIGPRLYVAVWTERLDRCRLISLRAESEGARHL